MREDMEAFEAAWRTAEPQWDAWRGARDGETTYPELVRLRQAVWGRAHGWLTDQELEHFLVSMQATAETMDCWTLLEWGWTLTPRVLRAIERNDVAAWQAAIDEDGVSL